VEGGAQGEGAAGGFLDGGLDLRGVGVGVEGEDEKRGGGEGDGGDRHQQNYD